MKKGVSKTVLVIAVVAIIAIATGTYILASSQPPAQQKFVIKIYTGGVGGVYYPLGTKLAQLLNSYSDGLIEASVATSNASVANVQALAAGDAQLIFVQNNIATFAYNGERMFGTPVSTIRGVASLYNETFQLVVKADSEIHSITDLTGKRVAIGAQGSGTAVDAEQILRAANVWNNITILYADFNDATEQLKLGQVDAAVIEAGVKTSAVETLASTTPINLVEIPDNVFQTLTSQGYTYYIQQTVNASTYNGMTHNVKTIAVRAMLAVSEDMPKNIAYTITKILFEHQAELEQAHPIASSITLATTKVGMSIPLHEGATQYYDEKGV